ncbi:MAG TPA: hypothetical protein VF941_20620 [Clostridia bacterium]
MGTNFYPGYKIRKYDRSTFVQANKTGTDIVVSLRNTSGISSEAKHIKDDEPNMHLPVCKDINDDEAMSSEGVSKTSKREVRIPHSGNPENKKSEFYWYPPGGFICYAGRLWLFYPSMKPSKKLS